MNNIICKKDGFRFSIFIANKFIGYCCTITEAKLKARKLSEENPDCLIQIRENILTYRYLKN